MRASFVNARSCRSSVAASLTLTDGVPARSDVDGEVHKARNDIARTWRRVDLPNGAYQPFILGLS